MLHGHGFDMLKVTLRVCTKSHIFEYSICNRAARYIACNWHAHLVSKAGSVIIHKSPSPVFKWNGILSSPVEVHQQATQFALRIADESQMILNMILRSLSVNYGSVY